MKRICRVCHIEKDIELFYKRQPNGEKRLNICKECEKIRGSKYYQENKEKCDEINKKYYQNNKSSCIERSKKHRKTTKGKEQNKRYINKNKDKISKYNKQYYIENKENIDKNNKEYNVNHKEEMNEYKRQYYQENKEKIKAATKRNVKKNKKHYDEYNRKIRKKSQYKIKHNLIGRVYSVIKCKGYKKSVHTMELVGCEIEFLMNHLQSTAIKKGYDDFDINNYDGKEYHIDHIIPCDAFYLEKSYHQRLCFHWSNLQILLGSENESKNAKLDFRLVEEFKNDPKELQTIQGFPAVEEIKSCDILQFIRLCDKNISQSYEHLEEITNIRKVA